jgi:hypothetical protein
MKEIDTDIFELNVGVFAELGDACECRILLDDHLAEAHLRAAKQRTHLV